jgi:SOS response regulatory protein OraA/RecX
MKKAGRAAGPLEPSDLEAAALRYLNRFDCSVQKLRTHLAGLVRRRGGDRVALEEHLATLLTRYQASGVLNDARFACRSGAARVAPSSRSSGAAA